MLCGCDTCDKPATHQARDAHETEPENGWKTYKPGPWRYGCDSHPVHSATFDQKGLHDPEIDAMNIIAASGLRERMED